MMCDEDKKELSALREFAAGKCVIQKVIDELGPMSLWSKAALEREIARSVAAEHDRVCDAVQHLDFGRFSKTEIRECVRIFGA